MFEQEKTEKTEKKHFDPIPLSVHSVASCSIWKNQG
jgi:hypothetical protein